MKLCIDCKYCVEPRALTIAKLCEEEAAQRKKTFLGRVFGWVDSLPDLIVLTYFPKDYEHHCSLVKSPVTGEPVLREALLARCSGEKCGPAGKHWELKS